MLRDKNKDIRTTLTSSVFLVDFQQVNVCWDVIKSLLNAFGLFQKCYTANDFHAHLISTGTML